MTATDLVLTVTQMLRKRASSENSSNSSARAFAFVARRSRDDRQYGARIWRDLRLLPGRFGDARLSDDIGAQSRAGRPRRGLCKGAGPLPHATAADPVFTETLELDLAAVMPSMAGPKRPEGRIALGAVGSGFKTALDTEYRKSRRRADALQVEGKDFDSRPWRCRDRRDHLLHQHLESERADRRGPSRPQCDRKGISTKPWVKTSLAPGSQVVAEYLAESGLQKSLDKLGFNLVGFGCTTCIGNSGPFAPEISKPSTTMASSRRPCCPATAISRAASAPTCRPIISPRRRSSSPMRSPARCAKDLTSEPLGHDKKGNPVFLDDIWPSEEEIADIIDKYVTTKVFKARYADVFNGDIHWRKVKAP